MTASDPLREAIKAGPAPLEKAHGCAAIARPKTEWPKRDPSGLIYIFRALEAIGVPGVGDRPAGAAYPEQEIEAVLRALERGQLVAVRYDDNDKRRDRLDPLRWEGDSGLALLAHGKIGDLIGHPGHLYIEETSLRSVLDGSPPTEPERADPANSLAINAEPMLQGAGSIGAAPIRSRGPRPTVRVRVTAEMRQRQDEADDLAAMTEEEMSLRFKASRDTCRKARSDVLGQ